jgi:hypothetical protein
VSGFAGAGFVACSPPFVQPQEQIMVDRNSKLYKWCFGATVSALTGFETGANCVGGAINTVASTVVTAGAGVVDGVKHKVSEVPVPRITFSRAA